MENIKAEFVLVVDAWQHLKSGSWYTETSPGASFELPTHLATMDAEFDQDEVIGWFVAQGYYTESDSLIVEVIYGKKRLQWWSRLGLRFLRKRDRRPEFYVNFDQPAAYYATVVDDSVPEGIELDRWALLACGGKEESYFEIASVARLAK